jgi:hypothetical protein
MQAAKTWGGYADGEIFDRPFMTQASGPRKNWRETNGKPPALGEWS